MTEGSRAAPAQIGRPRKCRRTAPAGEWPRSTGRSTESAASPAEWPTGAADRSCGQWRSPDRAACFGSGQRFARADRQSGTAPQWLSERCCERPCADAPRGSPRPPRPALDASAAAADAAVSSRGAAEPGIGSCSCQWLPPGSRPAMAGAATAAQWPARTAARAGGPAAASACAGTRPRSRRKSPPCQRGDGRRTAAQAGAAVGRWCTDCRPWYRFRRAGPCRLGARAER